MMKLSDMKKKCNSCDHSRRKTNKKGWCGLFNPQKKVGGQYCRSADFKDYLVIDEETTIQYHVSDEVIA